MYQLSVVAGPAHRFSRLGVVPERLRISVLIAVNCDVEECDALEQDDRRTAVVLTDHLGVACSWPCGC